MNAQSGSPTLPYFLPSSNVPPLQLSSSTRKGEVKHEEVVSPLSASEFVSAVESHEDDSSVGLTSPDVDVGGEGHERGETGGTTGSSLSLDLSLPGARKKARKYERKREKKKREREGGGEGVSSPS